MKCKNLILAALVAAAGVLSAFTTLNANTEYQRPTFVKTNARCGHSNCSCSGYWGFKHTNGTYEGSCSNSDGWGHTCGHSPSSHGLRNW